MVGPFDIHNANLLAGAEPKDLYTGDCRGCGQCCSRIIPLSEHDIERMSKYARRHHIEPVPDRAGADEIDMLCPWLSDERTCLIYHARPDICRAYRCDMHVRHDFSSMDRFLRHGPYESTDLRSLDLKRGA